MPIKDDVDNFIVHLHTFAHLHMPRYMILWLLRWLWDYLHILYFTVLLLIRCWLLDLWNLKLFFSTSKAIYYRHCWRITAIIINYHKKKKISPGFLPSLMEFLFYLSSDYIYHWIIRQSISNREAFQFLISIQWIWIVPFPSVEEKTSIFHLSFLTFSTFFPHSVHGKH